MNNVQTPGNVVWQNSWTASCQLIAHCILLSVCQHDLVTFMHHQYWHFSWWISQLNCQQIKTFILNNLWSFTQLSSLCPRIDVVVVMHFNYLHCTERRAEIMSPPWEREDPQLPYFLRLVNTKQGEKKNIMNKTITLLSIFLITNNVLICSSKKRRTKILQ